MARISESLNLNLGVTATRLVGRFRAAVRTVSAPAGQLDIDLTGSATVNAQFWLNRFPWRPTAGWAVVAALLSLGVLWRSVPIEWSVLALLWLLADPLWGSIWRLAGGRTEVLPLRKRDLDQSIWLPYLEPGSPAALLLGQQPRGVLHLLFRVALPSVMLAGAIALVLGPSAVWLTVVLLAMSMLGWISRHTFGIVPAVLHSVVTIVLPWLLALSLLGVRTTDEAWPALGALVLMWSLHNWGEIRLLRAGHDVLGIMLLAVADAGIALLLVTERSPIGLALLAVLWLPTWVAVYRRQPMLRLNFWWLAAMLVSAAALGQGIEF